jgi:hypothetical protein
VHPAIVRQGLSPTAAAILTAHIALSTGWGRAADNYRLAGIKATSESQDYTVVEGSEYVLGVEQPKTPMKWRSYDTLDQGVAAVLGLLQQPRYAASWALLTAGDTGYFRQLGLDGWYTAPPAKVETDCLSRLKAIYTILGTKPAESTSLLVASAVIGAGFWIAKKVWK